MDPKLTLMLAICSLGCAATAPPRPADPRARPVEQAPAQEIDLTPLIQPLIDDRWVSRLSIGLVDGEHTRIQRYGEQSESSSTELYELGSLSKVLTATTLAVLADAEIVGLRDPIARCLPRSPDITFYDLATHTSGLAALPPNLGAVDLRDPYASYTEAQLQEALASVAPTRSSESRFAYSNFGFGVLGHALGLCAASSYESVVRERVLAPLGMNDTTLALAPQSRSRLVQGHDADGMPMGPWTFGALAGAGGWRSTLDDMIRFLTANADPTASPLGDALQMAHALARPNSVGPRIGLAWMGTDEGWLWHNGQTAGSHGFIAFSPVTKRGVVILSDTATEVVDRLGMALMRVMHGRDAAFSVPETVALSSGDIDRLVGRYVFAPDVEIAIEHRDGALYGTLTGQAPLKLYPSTATDLYYRAVDAKMEIVLDDDGRVSGLRLHQGGAISPATKAPPPGGP
jgi:CubicO group peptidase (beta-lactamase class C family)